MIPSFEVLPLNSLYLVQIPFLCLYTLAFSLRTLLSLLILELSIFFSHHILAAKHYFPEKHASVVISIYLEYLHSIKAMSRISSIVILTPLKLILGL